MNRGPDDIKAEILTLAWNGALKTRIMSGCSISFRQLNFYLDLLIKKGLLESTQNQGKIYFRTTEHGKEWLNAFRQLKAIEDSI